MANIKIQGCTARFGEPPLCHSCKHALVVKGSRAGDEIIQCARVEERITFPVTSCTGYVDRQHPSLYDMEDIAWVLRTDAKRNEIGFVRSKDLKLRDRHVLIEDS